MSNHTHDEPQPWEGVLIATLAGACTVLGGLSLFCFKHFKPLPFALALGIASGVMLYITLVEMVPTALSASARGMASLQGFSEASNLAAHESDHHHDSDMSKAVGWLVSSICVFVGWMLGWLISIGLDSCLNRSRLIGKIQHSKIPEIELDRSTSLAPIRRSRPGCTSPRSPNRPLERLESGSRESDEELHEPRHESVVNEAQDANPVLIASTCVRSEEDSRAPVDSDETSVPTMLPPPRIPQFPGHENIRTRVTGSINTSDTQESKENGTNLSISVPLSTDSQWNGEQTLRDIASHERGLTKLMLKSKKSLSPFQFAALKLADASFENDRSQFLRIGLFTALALALHNFPEGMATYTSYMESKEFGYGMAIGVAIHNIPEGVAVAVPCYHGTGSWIKALGLCTICALAEPLGALIVMAIKAMHDSDLLDGILFSLMSGLMLRVALSELLTTGFKYDPLNLVLMKSVCMGMGIMAFSLVIFEFVGKTHTH